MFKTRYIFNSPSDCFKTKFSFFKRILFHVNVRTSAGLEDLYLLSNPTLKLWYSGGVYNIISILERSRKTLKPHLAVHNFTTRSSSRIFCWKPPGRAVCVRPQAAKYAKNTSEIEIRVVPGVG